MIQWWWEKKFVALQNGGIFSVIYILLQPSIFKNNLHTRDYSPKIAIRNRLLNNK